MAHSLFGLRFYAVVGCDHDDNDIGDLGSSSAHSCESLVARSIDKGNIFAVFIYHVGAHVLRDAACFASCHARASDVV